MFQKLLLSVASKDAKKFIGRKAQNPVVFDLGRTISELILANSSKTPITDDYDVRDYELPTGSGILELANVGKVFLFESVKEVSDAIPAKDSNSIVSQWKVECACGKILTPAALKANWLRFAKANGEKEVGFDSISKQHLTLSKLQFLAYDKRNMLAISDGEHATVDKWVSYFLNVRFDALKQYGYLEPVANEEIQAEWLFKFGAVNTTTDFDGPEVPMSTTEQGDKREGESEDV
jgi:hypothetical protein